MVFFVSFKAGIPKKKLSGEWHLPDLVPPDILSE